MRIRAPVKEHELLEKVHILLVFQQRAVQRGNGIARIVATENLGANASLLTNGGSIETGSVSGELVAKTNGGNIDVENATGTVDVESNGGDIELGHMRQAVKAKSSGGGIKIWKAVRKGFVY